MTNLLLILLLFGNFAFSQCLGDVNEDYNIDILDVVLILGNILDDDEIDTDIADINDDGNIDILDIIGVVNAILGFGTGCGDGICDNEYSDLDGSLISCDIDCEESFGDCYYSGDLNVLQALKDLNESLEELPLLNIGNQEWEDGRLTELHLGLYGLTSLPESIGNLGSLEELRLESNQLTSLPESICNLPDDCSIIVYNNNLCEEFHYVCIDQWDYQDSSNCDCNGITLEDDQFNPCIKLYVCDQVTDEVLVLDPSSDNLWLITTVSIDFSDDDLLQDIPHFVAIDETNGYWFVTTIQSGFVGMYCLDADTLISSIEVGDFPALLAVEPVSQMLYVSRLMSMGGMQNGGIEPKINVLDYSSGGLVHMDDIYLTNLEDNFTSNDFFPEPYALSVYHHITRPYPTLVTASVTEDWFARIDLLGANNPFIVPMDEDTPEMDGFQNGVLFPVSVTQKDNHIFFSCHGGGDIEGQVRSYSISELIQEDVYMFNTDSSPWSIVSSPTSNNIFVVLENEGIVSLGYDDSGVLTLNWEIPITGATLHGVTVSSDGTMLYVSSRGNGSIYIIDVILGGILNITPVGSSLSGIAIRQF